MSEQRFGQVFDYVALGSLHEAVLGEVKDLLDRVADNGSVTLKPGSPCIAAILGLIELVQAGNGILEHKMGLVKKAYEA